MAERLGKTSDFRAFLLDELNRRTQKNPSYNIRRFARDLGFNSSVMWDILNARRGLSVPRAKALAKALKLSKSEQAFFIDLVAAICARSKSSRDAAQARVQHHRGVAPLHFIPTSDFESLAQWYHFAILQLSTLVSFQESPEWISSHLGIDAESAANALKVLRERGLLRTRSGHAAPSHELISAPPDIPSAAVRKLHKQVLARALDAIDRQSVKEREYSSVFLPVNPARISAAKLSIRNFCENFVREFGQDSPKRKLCCLGIQFFGLMEDSTS